jgi:23S rRNA pseudouridine2605 synthase
LTVEQLEAARAERMRQNGHGAVTIEDVRTWIEETGLCIFLPRSAQAGFTAPTFVEAVAGNRTTEPTLELIREAESLLVRLENDGIAVRLNLAGQPGDQPDYVVAGWVLPYIYALRGDRDWRRAPQLTGSRQVSPLAVQVAKHLESANQTALQLRDALGRETSESAVLRALHELWKQLRVIPVVPEPAKAALWQPLRQRFQKAIAEGASTSQVTAISVLASIYLQAVIAAGMEDIELFLAPLTSRSKIREVVRGLAATRQVHSTSLGHGPLYYVAGTLPDFPAVPSYQAQQGYRSSGYRSPAYADEYLDSGLDLHPNSHIDTQFGVPVDEDISLAAVSAAEAPVAPKTDLEPVLAETAPAPVAKAAAHRPRPGKTAASAHPRERSRSAGSNDERRRTPAPRNGARPAASNGRNASHSNGHGTNGNSNGRQNGNGVKPAAGSSRNGSHKSAKPAARPAWGKTVSSNGSKPAAKNGRPGTRPAAHGDARPVSRNGAAKAVPNGLRNGAKTGKPVSNSSQSGAKSAARPATHGTARPGSRPATDAKRKPATASASKRYSFAGQAKQAPKSAAPKHGSSSSNGSRTSGKAHNARPSAAKRRG